jgi:hypothetical protein
MTRRRPGRLHRTRRRRRRPSRRRPTRITTRAQSINRDRRWISLALISEFMVALQSSRSVMMPPAAHRRGRYSRHRQQSEGACGRCCATQPGRDPPPPPCADRECAGDAEARGELRFQIWPRGGRD